MLPLLSPLFEAGLGGRLGRGKQWLAWIGREQTARPPIRTPNGRE
ncbi:MAG: hypothetical protein ACRDOH_16595 [Streptosporangiaceae bacterium]